MDDDRLESAIEGLRVSSEARFQRLEAKLEVMLQVIQHRTISPVLFWGVVTLLAIGVVIGWIMPIHVIEKVRVIGGQP
jgi:hypothetical protein